MNYRLRAFKVAEALAPGPLSYYMSHWDLLDYSPHFTWLVQGGGRTILINTGLPQKTEDLKNLNDACLAFHPKNEFLADRIWPPQKVLSQVGVKPEDVDTVLIISMGAYATGSLELFRNAQIYLSRAGWIDFLAPQRPSLVARGGVFTDSTLTYLITEGWERLHLVGNEEELFEGIKMFWAGCHHRGSMAVSIQTAKGKVVISDSIFRFENFEKSIPIGVLENLFEFYDALDRIRKEADIVIPTHDNELLVRFPNGIIA
jgi:glyoxylase-like metal-dependent hydrolase (beta-lactamase superfamily II)